MSGKMPEITLTPSFSTVAPLPLDVVVSRVHGCARLPSLRSIDSALRELLNADQRYTQQISEVIRRDPSLTARLLRLVNSVYYGLTTPVNNIEEAVFYLGVRQIRQLAMVTPIIEDFQKLAGKSPFPWRQFWQHCIATAILTREVTNVTGQAVDEADYVAGLVHDVGKIVMAAAFPEHFEEVRRQIQTGTTSRLDVERNVLGIDHTELGAIYLEHHHLPPVMVETARHHHKPSQAAGYANIVASVQIADLLVRHAEIGDSGNPEPVDEEAWLAAEGWDILFPPGRGETERSIARAALKRSLERLPQILEGLV
jgi:putative nucleotidyltransferase with HDIG domain